MVHNVCMANDGLALGSALERVYSWALPFDAILVNVQNYCTSDGDADATWDARKDGTTVLTGVVTMVNDAVSTGTLTTAAGVAFARGNEFQIYVDTGATSRPDGVNFSSTWIVTGHPSNVS